MSKPKFVFTVLTCTLAATCVVLIGVGQLLSDRWTVTSTRTVHAPVAQVAPLLVDFGEWRQWSAWDMPLGNPTRQLVDGEPGTAGHRWIWEGPLGRAEIATSEVDAGSHRFTMSFHYADSGERFGGTFRGEITWREAGDDTEVTWTETNRVDRLVDRWAMWFGALQEKVRQVQGASLNGLEQRLHRGPGEPTRR